MGNNNVAFSPDGLWVLTAGGHRTVQVWDRAVGNLVHELADVKRNITSLAFSPDGKRLAAAAPDRRTVLVWDGSDRHPKQWKEPRAFPRHSSPVTCATFSPDSLRVACGCTDGRVIVWDVAGENQLFDWAASDHGDPVSGIAFSRDGRYLAAGSLGQVRVWDAPSGEPVRTLEGLPHRVLSVAFSPDGKYLAASGGYKSRGEIKLWDSTLWDRPRAANEPRVPR